LKLKSLIKMVLWVNNTHTNRDRMSHARYEVKWNSNRSKWEVLEERRNGGYYVLSRYRLKKHAKEHAVRLAKRDNARAGFYSKDPQSRERRTATRDFR